ncbi:MAG: DUF21 domain-containing protein [Simkaniaceae bacterium]|nr:DUF21 domain-containing protein [Simkaniaceae bacterium]
MIYLFLTLLCLALQAFFAMQEMAAVSFNRVRLQYYAFKGNRRALWLSRLLHSPTTLFGTTLIGVNMAMQFGSECARRFFIGINLSPEWALLSQVIVVLIFAELAPMFAARRFPEQVAMFGMPLIFLASKILRPLIWVLGQICRLFNFFFGINSKGEWTLTRDELLRAMEEVGERTDPVFVSLFAMKNKIAREVMRPLHEFPLLPIQAKVSDARALLVKKYLPFIPLYERQKKAVVSVLYVHQLFHYSHEAILQPIARNPWFITEDTSIIEILKQFRFNNESVAIVLNQVGLAQGILTLDMVVQEVFGPKGEVSLMSEQVMVECSFPGDTEVEEVEKKLDITLEGKGTLIELMEQKLGRFPEKGERVEVGSYYLILTESSLLGEGTISLISR